MPLVVLVFGGRVVPTAGEAEISAGGTEGGGHPESGRSRFFFFQKNLPKTKKMCSLALISAIQGGSSGSTRSPLTGN